MTRFIRVAVVGVASLLFLAACGGDDESPTTPGATSAGITNVTVGSANFPKASCLPRSTPPRSRERASRSSGSSASVPVRLPTGSCRVAI
jgi:hypothetical protein